MAYSSSKSYKYTPNTSSEWGLQSYNGSSNAYQMRTVQKAYTTVTDNTDAGKAARKISENVYTIHSTARAAYYRHEMSNFAQTHQYNYDNLQKAITESGVGYTSRGTLKFENIYDTNIGKEATQFRETLKKQISVDNNFITKPNNVKLQSSVNEMLKTGEVKYKFKDVYGKIQSGTYSLDNIVIDTKAASGTNGNLIDLETRSTSTNRTINGHDWLKSFSDTTYERQIKLINNGNLADEFLKTSGDLRIFRIDRMSSSQILKELDKLATNPAGSKFASLKGQENLINLVKEAAEVKAGKEFAEQANNAFQGASRSTKIARHKAAQYTSDGNDFIAGYSQIQQCSDIAKLGVKSVTSIDKAYHNINKRNLERLQLSPNTKKKLKAQKTYEKMYGKTGFITKRDQAITNVKQKINVKGNLKNKVVDINKTKRLKKREKRHELFKVRFPKLSKFTGKIKKAVQWVTDPLAAAKQTIKDFFVKKIIASKFTAIVGTVITAILGFIFNVISVMIKAITSFVIASFVAVGIIFGPAFIVTLLFNVVFSAIGNIADVFNGDSQKVETVAEAVIEEELSDKYTDDEIEIIKIILSEKSGMNIAYEYSEPGDSAHEAGLGALGDNDYLLMMEWITEQDETVEPKEGETNWRGEVKQSYIERVTKIETQFLKEEGYLDEWLAAYLEAHPELAISGDDDG